MVEEYECLVMIWSEREIDLRYQPRFVDLSDIRQYLADFYSHTGRPFDLRP